MAKPNFILPNKPAIKAGSILSYNYTDDLKFAAEPLDFSRNGSATRVNDQGLIETTSANLPRIDHSDSSTEPSLLLEPQSTNLLIQSETFSNWQTENGNQVVTTGVVISPDGTQNGNKLVTYNGGETQRKLWVQKTVTPGESYTFSVYIKKVSGQLNTGFLHITTGPNDSYDATQEYTATDQWQRISVTTSSASSTPIRFLITGDSDSQIYIWGAQLEQKSYATSYIPTSGSTATRLGETANNAGGAGVFNSEEGVLYAEIKTLSQTGTFRQINLSNGTASSRIYISKRAENNNFEFRMDNPSGSLNFSFPLDTTSSFVKLAFRYGLNNFAVFINGVNKNVSSTGNVFSSGTLNNLEFSSPLNQPFYGKTKNLKVFNYALTDEELQTLTT